MGADEQETPLGLSPDRSGTVGTDAAMNFIERAAKCGYDDTLRQTRSAFGEADYTETVSRGAGGRALMQ
jgi:hypothetical protein